MSATDVLLERTALASSLAIFGVLALRWTHLQTLSKRNFRILSFALLCISRVGLFVAIFFIAHMPPHGDVPGYYVPEAESALHHKIPYLQFPSSYAPLHPYLDAALLRIWRSPLALGFFSICCEIALFPIWIAVAGTFARERILRIAAVLYLFSPISIQFNVVDGVDNVAIALALVIALLLLLHDRPALSGATIGLTIVGFKFLPLIFVPAFVLVVSRRWRWLAGFFGVVGPVYVCLACKHVPFLQPLTFEGSFRTACGLPYLFELTTGISVHPRVWDIITILALLSIYVAITASLKRLNSSALLSGSLAAITLAVVLFSKKSWPNYLVLTLFPICLIVAALRPIKQFLFYLLSVLAAVVGGYWASTLSFGGAQIVHASLKANDRTAVWFLPMLISLVAGYGWLLLESMRGMLQGSDGREQEANAGHQHCPAEIST